MDTAIARPTSVRWRILILLLGMNAIAYVLRVNVSIAAPAMKSDLGLSEVQLGLVLSAFVTTYAICQIPGGLLGEWAGPRRAMTWLVTGWGVATMLTGLVPGPAAAPLWAILTALVVFRGALGVFQAPFYPITTGGTIAAWFPVNRWALANAMGNTAFTVASASAGPIGVWLILHFGWRASIIVSAPITLALAAMCAMTRGSTPASTSRKSISSGLSAPGRPSARK